MPKIGEHADMLRALGAALDQVGVGRIEITSHEHYLSVSWPENLAIGKGVSYQEHDLVELRSQARAMRKGASRGEPGSRAELLRTLGQELDRSRIDMTHIVEEPDGFLVSGSAEGRYVRRLFTINDLETLSSGRRAMRGLGYVPEPPPSLPPIGVGTPVSSRDNWRLGIVKQVMGDRFEVKAPVLQRDYWLPARFVDRVTADQVLLSLTREEVDQHRTQGTTPVA